MVSHAHLAAFKREGPHSNVKDLPRTCRRCRDAHLQALSRRALAGDVATLGLQDGTLGVRDGARVAGMTLGLRDGR